MGIETIVFAGLTAFQAISSMKDANAQAKQITKNAKAQADALTQQGNLQVEERRKRLRYETAKQTVSFINAGLTLEGTPGDVIGETYDTGIADLKQIRSNYTNQIGSVIDNARSQAKSTVAQGRNAAIGAIANGFSSFGTGGAPSTGAAAADGFNSGVGVSIAKGFDMGKYSNYNPYGF